MITVEIEGFKATVQDGVWNIPDKPDLTKILQDSCGPTRLEGYWPNIDEGLAQMAVDRLDAKIIQRDKPVENPDEELPTEEMVY